MPRPGRGPTRMTDQTHGGTAYGSDRGPTDTRSPAKHARNPPGGDGVDLATRATRESSSKAHEQATATPGAAWTHPAADTAPPGGEIHQSRPKPRMRSAEHLPPPTVAEEFL